MGVKRELIDYGSDISSSDLWSGNMKCQDGWETQARCYGNDVFTKYVRSEHGG